MLAFGKSGAGVFLRSPARQRYKVSSNDDVQDSALVSNWVYPRFVTSGQPTQQDVWSHAVAESVSQAYNDVQAINFGPPLFIYNEAGLVDQGFGFFMQYPDVNEDGPIAHPTLFFNNPAPQYVPPFLKEPWDTSSFHCLNHGISGYFGNVAQLFPQIPTGLFPGGAGSPEATATGGRACGWSWDLDAIIVGQDIYPPVGGFGPNGTWVGNRISVSRVKFRMLRPHDGSLFSIDCFNPDPYRYPSIPYYNAFRNVRYAGPFHLTANVLFEVPFPSLGYGGNIVRMDFFGFGPEPDFLGRVTCAMIGDTVASFESRTGLHVQP